MSFRWVGVVMGLAAVVLAPIPVVVADTTVVVTKSDDLTWKGWGCSLAWWANAVGGTAYADTYADIVFSLKGAKVTFADRSAQLPGLGLNVIRYNVGGGGPGNTLHNHMASYKDIQGYWPIAWSNWNPSAAGWKWDADAGQRSMMLKARDRGADHVQFFSNSPMWWMTRSKSTNGAATRGENLDERYYGWFCNYLARVVRHARTAWGVKVESVDAFNEPSAYWWDIADGCSQEGCTFHAGSQARLIPLLRHALDEAGERGVRIAASDENDPATAKKTFDALGKDVQKMVGPVTTHGYYGLKPYRDNGGRQRLRAAIGNRELWMTEYGDGEGGGEALSESITSDINYERPTAWVYWQPVEPSSGWGLLNANYETGATNWVYTKYFVFATFTRTIRPGMLIWKSSDPNTLFAYDPRAKKLTILTVNEGAAQRLKYDLSSLKTIGRGYGVIRTRFDGSEKLAELGPVALSSTERASKTFAADVPAKCVSVLKIDVSP